MIRKITTITLANLLVSTLGYASQQSTLGLGTIALKHDQKAESQTKSFGISNFLGQKSVGGFNLSIDYSKLPDHQQSKGYDTEIFFNDSVSKAGEYAGRNGYQLRISKDESKTDHREYENHQGSFTGTMGLGSFDIGLNFTYKDRYSIDNSLLSDENTRKFSKQYGPDYTISVAQQVSEKLRYALILSRSGMQTYKSKTKVFGGSGKDISTRDRKNQFSVDVNLGTAYELTADQLLLFGFSTYTDPEKNTAFRTNEGSSYDVGYQIKLGQWTPRFGINYYHGGKEFKGNRLALGTEMHLQTLDIFSDITHNSYIYDGELFDSKTQIFEHQVGMKQSFETANIYGAISTNWSSTEVSFSDDSKDKRFTRYHGLSFGVEQQF